MFRAPMISVMCLLFAGCRESKPLRSDPEWNARAVIGMPPSKKFAVKRKGPGAAKCSFMTQPETFLEWFRRWQVAQDHLGADFQEYSFSVKQLVRARGGAKLYAGDANFTCNGVPCSNYVELRVNEAAAGMWAVSILVQEQDFTTTSP